MGRGRTLRVNYPDERQRDLSECRANGQAIREGLKWIGKPAASEVDVCEDGSAYCGLTQVLPPGSIVTPTQAHASRKP